MVKQFGVVRLSVKVGTLNESLGTAKTKVLIQAQLYCKAADLQRQKPKTQPLEVTDDINHLMLAASDIDFHSQHRSLLSGRPKAELPTPAMQVRAEPPQKLMK